MKECGKVDGRTSLGSCIKQISDDIFWNKIKNILNFEEIIRNLYKPTDPACLGVVRVLFGLCMVLDVVEERGLADVDLKWGNPNGCNFPLIHGMGPPSLPWMVVLYTIMWIGAFGIMLGLAFKKACACFIIPYWYMFVLDKSLWNNHSYLYGVVAILLWGTGANRYFALDSMFSKKIENENVPMWNYLILKFQFFILYFLAGMKKSSKEWLEGYSMTNLSTHWVFSPFRLLLSIEQTDYLIVHWFCFIFDSSIGFFILFDKTRVPAAFLCTLFHLMNSRLFSIGMFPYVCLATMPLFCDASWPRQIKSWFTESKLDQGQKNVKSDGSFKCAEMYKRNNGVSVNNNVKGQTNSEELLARDSVHCHILKANPVKKIRVTNKKKIVTLLLACHVVLQFFLPYSHFITKGYNNWVPGLYGYSWDMMVHSWDTIRIVIRLHDNDNDQDHFLDPNAWVQNLRWSKHGDMVRQYAFCLKENILKQKQRVLKSHNDLVEVAKWQSLSTNFSIYVDVWCSLNGRFQQRVFNPNVDMLTVDWHPLMPVSYLMPLLTQFSSYRTELDKIQKHVYTWSNYTEVLFVADYPGMQLENYFDEEFSNVSLTVLEGEVAYREEGWRDKRTMVRGGIIQIETGRFHKVETTSPHPASYMYTFTNQTKQQLAAQGIYDSPKVTEALPLMKEFKYRVNAWVRAFGQIGNALLHLLYGHPMLRRIRVN